MKQKSFLLLIFSLLLWWLPLLPAMATEIPFTGWLVAKTEHFNFIYEDADNTAIAQLLSFCEEVYDQVTGLLDSRPAKIDCIIRGRLDYTNAFYTSLPNHLELYLTPPKLPGLKGDWLRHLLTHELTHYIHLVYQQGVNAGIGDLFGDSINALLTMAFLPGWAIEGITTNTETMFTTGGRGRDYFFEMYYKAPVIEGELFSLNQAAYASHLAPSGRIYVGGYILVNYIMQEYGPDAFTAIHKKNMKPFGNLGGAIRQVTGKTPELLYRNMQGALTLRFQTDRLLPAGEPISPKVQGNWYLPHLTSRGWYLYRTNPEKRGAIVVFDPADRSEEIILETGLTDPYSLSVAPDGSRLIFARITERYLNLKLTAASSDLYVYNRDSGALTQLTREAHLWQPALSPDGSRLVAVQKNGSSSRLVEVDQQSGQVRLLFSRPQTTIYTPVFDPGSTKIVFVMKDRDQFDLYLLDLAGLTPAPPDEFPQSYNSQAPLALLGPDAPGDYYPRFAGDTTLLFSSERDGALKMYSLELTDRTYHLLAEDPVGAFAGVIAEDKLIYGSYSSTGFNLKTKPLPADDSNPVLPLPAAAALTPVTADLSVSPTPPVVEGIAWAGIPRPMYWLPEIKMTLAEVAGSDALLQDLGLGAIISAANPTLTHLWNAGLYYHPMSRQFSGNLEYSFVLGRQQFSLRLAQGYFLDDEIWKQSTGPSLGVETLLYYDSGISSYALLRLSNLLSYRYAISGAEPFAFPGTQAAGGIEQNITLLTTLTFFTREYTAMADLYDRDSLFLDLNIGLGWPLPAGWLPKLNLHGRLSHSLGLPGWHHNLKWGLKAGWQPAGGAEKLVSPRGRPRWEGASSQLQGVASLQYQLALPLMELNVGVFHITGMGLGAQIEGSTGYSLEQGFLWDNHLYAGLESSLVAGYLGASISFTLGVNVRLNTATFLDLGQRIFYPYFALSLDSFLDSFLDSYQDSYQDSL